MKIGVTGYRGRLGSELVKQGCISIEADVTNFHHLGQVVREVQPDVIIHCAAKTNVDMCETSAVSATTVNFGGTFGLTQVFTGKIVYISTDYIFDGTAGPYSEDARPNPISIYGWTKLGGELAIKNSSNPAHLIVRTTVLFDRNGNNFVTKVIDQLLQGNTVNLPDQLYGSPTYVPHLVEAILMAVDRDLTGIINLGGSMVMSRFTFGQEIARLLNKPIELIQSGPIVGRAPRPRLAGLRTDKAHILRLPIYDPLNGVKEVINALETMAAG